MRAFSISQNCLHNAFEITCASMLAPFFTNINMAFMSLFSTVVCRGVYPETKQEGVQTGFFLINLNLQGSNGVLLNPQSTTSVTQVV